jgi:ABC-type branched-subunit amino acid transport system substrate-binding protein
MKVSMRRALATGATIFVLCAGANAQIRVGQTTGLSGPAAASVADMNVGAKLYLNHVNAKGGIGGKAIELVSLDDKNKPELTVANAKKLVADPQVVALFLNRGTPHTEALKPVLSEARIALLAPSTGAMSLHAPLHPWIFNVRATYQAEAERLVRHLGLVGLQYVGFCVVNDSFGADAMVGAMKVFNEQKMKPVVNELIDKSAPDYSECVKKVRAAKQLSVVMIGTSQSVAKGVKSLREAGGPIVTVATLSNNASAGFVKELGPHASGVVVSQVFPSERRQAVPMIVEAVSLATASKVKQVTPAMIEGFAAAKVLVLALKKATPDSTGRITREAFKRALESLNGVDIGSGDTPLGYSPTDHSGLAYVDLSIIAADGSFRR